MIKVFVAHFPTPELFSSIPTWTEEIENLKEHLSGFGRFCRPEIQVLFDDNAEENEDPEVLTNCWRICRKWYRRQFGEDPPDDNQEIIDTTSLEKESGKRRGREE